jgi:hypothetical protein
MVGNASPPTMVLPVHRLTPWFRVRISTGEGSIKTEHWQSALGCIPLRRRRIEIPYGDLGPVSFKTMMRLQCLLAAGVILAAILVWHPAIPVIVALGILGLYQLILWAPNKAVRIERKDGRAWTVRFCRDYAFDISLAFEDAALQAAVENHPGGMAAGEQAA